MPIVPAIYAVSAVTGILLTIYNSRRERPDVTIAEHLRALHTEQAMHAGRELRLEEKVRGEFAAERAGRLRDLVGTKQGLDTGTTSGAELGIEGGGMSARDMPMVNIMAARLGMDPKDLAARFDPTRSNIYVPASRRGESPRPLSPQATPAAGAPQGPAQMNPMAGFGS